ncbi:MAG: NADH-quinone oxidoreductase subunit A [Acidithiobacillus sp.]
MTLAPAPIVGIFALAVLLVLIAILWISGWLGGQHPNRNKNVPFESGLGVNTTTHPSMPVAFYLLAVSFLVFELEAAFLFAWAVAFHSLGWAPVIGGLIFMAILGLGLFYEWRMGGLQWH